MLNIRSCLAAMTVGLVALTPTLAVAQSPVDTIEDANGHFAEYTLLGAVPGCDFAGATAYQVDFEAGDVEYHVRHAPTGVTKAGQESRRSAQQVSGPIVPAPEERCFRTERRGTNVIRLETACSDGERRTDPFGLLKAQSITLSVTAEARVCVSLSEFAMLDGSWTAELESGLDGAVHSGAFLSSDTERCSEPVELSTPRATLNYAMPGIWGNPAEWSTYRRDDPSAAAVFGFNLAGVPLPSDNDGNTDFTIEARAFFFPASQGDAHCPNGICRAPNDLRRWWTGPKLMACQ